MDVLKRLGPEKTFHVFCPDAPFTCGVMESRYPMAKTAFLTSILPTLWYLQDRDTLGAFGMADRMPSGRGDDGKASG